MNFKSFDTHNLQLKYADTLSRIKEQLVFENEQSEINYHVQNSTWILEADNLYIHDTGKSDYMIFGGGNIAFVSKSLVESECINEADSVWVNIWNVIKDIASTALHTVTHIGDNIASIKNGDIAGISLAFGGICELLAILTVLWPPLHPLNVTLTVLAGLGLIIGGIAQCFKAGSSLGTLKHQAEKVHESSDSNDPIDIFSDGTQHIMMGVAGVALSSLGIFGGKGVKKTAAKVYQSTVKIGMKKSFKVIFKAMAKARLKQELSNKSLAAILKHESKHFFLHYVAAVIAFFLGENLTKKKEDGNSWLDLFRGLESTINIKTTAVTNTISKAKKGIKDTVGGHVDMLDNTVDSLFNGIEGIVGVLGAVLGTIVGKLGDLVELIGAFSELFRENTTEAAYETVYSAGKKEAQGVRRRFNKDLLPYTKTLNTESKSYVDKDGFAKMGASSTSVDVKYQGKVYQKVGNVVFDSDQLRKSSKMDGVLIATNLQKGKNKGKEYGVVRNKDGSYSFYNPKKVDEHFPSFDDFKKQNLNENVMNRKNDKYVKLFEEFQDMKEVEELHEGFMSRGINIAKEGIQEIKAFFFGLEASFWDKTAKFNKKDLLEVLDGTIEIMVKHADSDLLDQMDAAKEKIVPMIDSGKIKNSKQLVMAWQDAMDIYIIK